MRYLTFVTQYCLKQVIGLCPMILLGYALNGQNTYVVEHLGFAEGLPSINITAVTQDSQGLMWLSAFATGLIRHDGFTYKVYDQSPKSKLRLNDNHLRDLITDRKGRLWVAHNTGIDIIQPDRLELLHSIEFAGDDNTQKGQACSLCLDANGDIWVAAYNKGVFCIRNSDPNQVEFIDNIPEVDYINQTPDGKIYCSSTLSGMYVLENGHFKPTFPNFIADKKKLCQIKPIENETGIMVGFRLLGPAEFSKVYRFNLNSNQFDTGAPENGITVFTAPVMRKKMLEVASPLATAPLFGHAFRTFKDNQGIIWVAPEYGGIFKLKTREIEFTTCPDLNGVSLRGMIESKKNGVYIATYDGVFQYNSKINRAKRISKGRQDIYFQLLKIQGDTMTVLSESNAAGNFLMTYPWQFISAATSNFSKDFSFYAGLMLDENWFLTGNQQLLRIRANDLEVKPFGLLPTPVDVRSFCFKKARDGRIWVGTTEGVFIFSLAGVCEEPSFRLDYRLGAHSRINDILETESGEIWFATHNYGLLCYNPKNQEIKSFDQASGLASNETYKIASSHGGQMIWISTFAGLHCIELSNYKIHYFNEYDGTCGSEFNTGSFLQTKDGDFYFGGVRGLTRFNPNRFTPLARPAPEPYISELSIEDIYSSEINLISLPPQDTLLQFSNSQNTLEFHFGSNDYFRPKSNTFYVKLEPVDANWVPLGALTSMKYYRLDAGQYTLNVRFNNNRENKDSKVYLRSIKFFIRRFGLFYWWH